MKGEIKFNRLQHLECQTLTWDSGHRKPIIQAQWHSDKAAFCLEFSY